MTDSPIAILHVDDNDGFTTLLSEIFRQHHDDITIRTASDGEDALTHLEQADEIDCVVSDYELPDETGLELLTAVRERWPDLPFILYTGEGSEGIAERAIAAGVTDYLQKRPGTSQYTLLANRIRNAVEQRRLETELERTSRETAAQFDLLVGAVEDYAIFLLDEDGYIRTWNAGAEKIKGYTSEEIVGEHFSVFYTEDDVEAGVPERNLREAATEGRTRDEGWRVRKDGSEFWADVTITALRRGDDLLGYAKITHDSTERHHKQVLLDRNEQLKDLIAAISHDLRSPLTVAGGNVALTHETGDLSHLETASTALDRACELLDYLGTLAKEGKRVMEPEPVDLREVTQLSWDVVESNGAELAVEGSASLVADRPRLQELLENLLRNAVEHGSTSSRTQSGDSVEHAGPDVTVRVGPLEDGGFYVEDDGPGIPENERDEVFEVECSEKGDASGFGLAICEQIAGAHGWSIEVTDGADGGARFEVSGIEMNRGTRPAGRVTDAGADGTDTLSKR